MPTADWAVTAPLPKISTGVLARRLIPGTHVAEPTAISPVLVSIIRIDHVAEAGEQASPVAARMAVVERARAEVDEIREPEKRPMNTLLRGAGNDRGGARQI